MRERRARGTRARAILAAQHAERFQQIASSRFPISRSGYICLGSNSTGVPSALKGYRDIWEDHLHPICEQVWLEDARTYHVRGSLNQIAVARLSRNTLKHIKSVISGMFTLAKQQDHFQGRTLDPGASEPHEMYAYSLEDLQTIISLLPEPASTAFAVAAFMGLRQGEIQGLLWENYRDWVIYVSRSIWNGRVTDSKTRKGRPPIPVIRQLAERLEMHRLRCGNPQSGPIFAMQSANRSRCPVLSTESPCPR